jgi:hypothetical protein
LAKFNPDVPGVQDPNYIGWSKPIEQPKADTSMGELFKGIGDVGSEAATGVDFLVKKNIDDDVHAAIDTERNAYTDALKTADASVRPQTDANGNPIQGPQIMGGQDAPAVPKGLDSLNNSLSSIDGARANGKLSETAYLGRLDALAKQFRNQYPGYRDYIDQQFEKVTGVNPANAQIKSLLGDINSFVTKQNSEKDKTENFIREHFGDIPNAPMLLQSYHDGRITANDVYQVAYPRLANEAQFKYNAAALGDFKGRREQSTMFATDVGTSHVNNTASTILDSLVVAGIGGQQKVSDFLSDFQSGKLKNVPDENWNQVSQLIDMGKNQFLTKINKDLDTPINDQGETLRTRLGSENAAKLVKQGSEYFDNIQGSIHNKDFGTALTTTNIIKAQSTGALAAFMNDKDSGGLMRLLKAANDINPAFAQIMLTSGITSGLTPTNKAQLAVIGAQLTTPADIRSQPGVAPSSSLTPTPDYNISKAIDSAKATKAPKEMYNEILKLPQMITMPSVPDYAKVQVAKKTFSNDTVGLISKFAVDGPDPKTGQWIQGRYKVWNDLTSPKMAHEIYELGKQDPTVAAQYKNWAETTFATDGMFGKEIRDMKDVRLPPGMNLIWDSDKHAFDIVSENRTGILNSRNTNNAPDPFVKNTIKRINLGLEGLSNVAKESGLDVNAYLVHTLMGMGYDPKAGAPLTLPEHMMKAISGPDPMKYSEDSEKPGPTLRSWLKNPSGAINTRPSVNLIDQGPISGIDVQNIPEGMSGREFLKLLKERENGRR